MPTDVLTPTPLLKRCAICGESKPATADYFYRRAKSADGWQRHCRACSRASIDAAEARRREPQPLATTWDDLYAQFAARSDDVLDALCDSACSGSLNPFEDLADALEPNCPTLVPADADYDYLGPDCLLHDLARFYELGQAEQHPTVAEAVRARVAALFPVADAPEASESDGVPGTPSPA